MADVDDEVFFVIIFLSLISDLTLNVLAIS